MTEKKNKTNNGTYKILSAALVIASAVLVALSFVAFSYAKYVTEISGGDLPYEVQTPFSVKSQQELFNAIASGYGYVRLSDELDAPIIMTGDSLDLKSNLTIDLNGKEIQRNSRDSLLSVPAGTTFTVVDTAGGGALYNPIGSVLTLSGGDINVYGGIFESGPRPSEYLGNLSSFASELKAQSVIIEKCADNTITQGNMPILTMRGNDVSRLKKTGNVYFDSAFSRDGSGTTCTVTVPEDTYCYMITSDSTGDSMGAFDTSKTDFVYSYYVNKATGEYAGAEKPASGEYSQVKVFGYTKDIEKSLEPQKDESGNVVAAAPYYSAVYMDGGVLNVDVTAASDVADGSFYSYFGTWYSSCVYIKSGTMTVSTSGEFATVNPQDLSAHVKTYGKPNNSARYGEGACILASGGVLDVQKVRAATSYNGSIISVSGGEVHIKDANLSKYATLSHANSPFDIADEGGDEENGVASEFPANRQYRDAAIFINGGTLDIADSSIKVYKDIANTETNKTTFGILSRGRTDALASGLSGKGVQVLMHGSHSYGIFATRGKVELGESETRATPSKIVIDSDNTCYGVYAVNKSSDPASAVDIRLLGADIEVGPRAGQSAADPLANYGTLDTSTYVGVAPADLDPEYGSGENVHKPASIGVYLECMEKFSGGKVEIYGADVSSKEVGVAVYGGELNFYNEGSINAYNASAAVLRGGNIMFAENSRFAINCEINRRSDGAAKGADGSETDCEVSNAVTATNAGLHQYDIYVPWQDARETKPIYENNNAIRIIGGNLDALGDEFNVNFRGLYNDYDGVYQGNDKDDWYFDNLVVKSFAVNCDGGTVNINRANIVNTVGGGIKVEQGTINLGNSFTKSEDITVNTKGRVHWKDYSHVTKNNISAGISGPWSQTKWVFYPSLSGGHAVVARGGNINVYGGKYTAAFGNGVMVTNDGSVISSVNIYGGDFKGNLTHDRVHEGHYSGTTKDTLTSAGPASHYGMQVIGKADVTLKGGTYDGKNGGGYVVGLNESAIAEVKICEGIFGDGRCMEGFNVSDYSTTYFGAYTASELAGKDATQLIQVNSDRFAVSFNSLLKNITKANVYMYYGKYYTKSNDAGDSVDKCLVAAPGRETVTDQWGNVSHIDMSYHIGIYGYSRNYATKFAVNGVTVDMDAKWRENFEKSKVVGNYTDPVDSLKKQYLVRFFKNANTVVDAETRIYPYVDNPDSRVIARSATV